jgi:uncharacterized protein involved in outer membrane biogenesis
MEQKELTMSISRVLTSIGLVLVTVVAAAVLYLHYADLNRYRGDIEALVSDATGRQFNIDGELQLDLFPAPALILEQLSLSNASWSDAPMMAEIDHVSVRVNLWSLVSGPIVVESFKLLEAKLLLETNAEGESNWQFAGADTGAAEAPEADSDSGDTSLPLTIDFAEISQLLITMRQPDADDQIIRVDDFTIKPNASDNLDINATAEVLERPVTLSGQIGSREQLRSLETANFDLDATLGRLDVTVNGVVADLETLTGTSFKAVISTEDIADIVEAAGLSLNLSGPVRLDTDVEQTDGGARVKLAGTLGNINTEATFQIQGQKLDFDTRVGPLDQIAAVFDVTDAGLPTQPVALKGSIGLAEDAVTIQQLTAQLGQAIVDITGTLATGDGTSQLELKASGPSLADLLTTLPAIAFDASAAASLAPSDITLDPLQLTFGDSDLQGSLNVTMAENTTIDATLQSKRLDLKPFQPEPEPEPESVPASDQATAPASEADTEETDESNTEFVFVDEPLPLDSLQQIDADVELSIEQLLTRAIELDNVELDAGLHGGDLKAQLDFITPSGGIAASTLAVTTSGSLPEIQALIQARDIRVNISAAEDLKMDQLPATSITIKLDSRGTTPHTLASRSNGYVLLTQGPGLIDAGFLASASGDLLSQLFSALNPLAKEEKYSNWECSVIRLNIEDGIAELSEFLLQDQKIKIIAGGDIDLHTEKLDLEFNTKPRKGVGVSADMFVTPFVALKGRLASPRVGLNEKGVLLSGGAAVATGGISLLVQGAADRATGGIDQCQNAMAESGQHPPIGSNTGPDSNKPVTSE